MKDSVDMKHRIIVTAASSNRSDRQTVLPVVVRAAAHGRRAQTQLPPQVDDRRPTVVRVIFNFSPAKQRRQHKFRNVFGQRRDRRENQAPVDHRETLSPATADSAARPRDNENRRPFESASASPVERAS